MKAIALIPLPCLLLTGCPRATEDSAPPAAAPAAARARVVLLLSGSSESQWDAELLAALAAKLEFDPFAAQSSTGHLDILGPYELQLGATPVELQICLLGLDRLAGLESQTDLAVEAREWIANAKPQVAWLDGDRAQFFVGRELAGELPIVFTGVVSDRQAYYQSGATGVYERPALATLLELIWESAPKAARFALVSDDAPVSRGSVGKFNELLSVALRGQGSVTPLPPAEDWAQLRARLVEAQQSADAVILTGIGEEQGGEAFNTPCPAGLLKDVTIPVIAVGGSDAATCFPVVVRLRPSAHVELALGMVGQVLDGADPGGIPTVTPEEMQVLVNEGV